MGNFNEQVWGEARERGHGCGRRQLHHPGGRRRPPPACGRCTRVSERRAGVDRHEPPAHGRLYVQVPTWLWLNQSWWHPYEATARAGPVWSTVRVTPVEVVWRLGDGHTVVCRGPGTVWRPGTPADSSDCTYTYRNSSTGQPGGTFRIQAAVRFAVGWSSNAATGGTLPAITRIATLDVAVGEIQAIGTMGGR